MEYSSICPPKLQSALAIVERNKCSTDNLIFVKSNGLETRCDNSEDFK